MKASRTNKCNKGLMMEAQNYSVNDGEGIRTLLFLGGCPLRCKWCANPESYIMDEDNKFLRQYTIDQVLDLIDKQKIFYRFSNGGITFSGGEPTVQIKFLEEISERLYDSGFNLAIETCGYFNYERVKEVLGRMDLIFMDLKVMDEKDHILLTGQSNKIILENIRIMGQKSYPMVIRIPLIEGVNADFENIREAARFVKKYIKNPKIELLPYHELAYYKYEELGIDKPPKDFSRPSEKKINELKEIIKGEGVEVVSY